MARTWIVASLLAVGGCFPCSGDSQQVLTEPFAETFDGTGLGAWWNNTGGPYKVVNGELAVAGARNHPLWLRKKLPVDVRVAFEARSESPDGDIKFELFGDGRSFAQETSYTASGYVIIFGGWQNSLNVIARMDEHAPNRQVRRGPPVVPNRTYRIKAERRGKLLQWFVDDQLMLEFDDDQPLKGSGHEYFGFNNWETPLHFDNLTVTPL